MRPLIILALGLGLGATPRAWGQEFDKKLVVSGDVVTVVKSFPVTISAPDGADLYFWITPPGTTILDKGAKLDILAAPKGTLAIGVKLIRVDWDAKKVVQEQYSVAIIIGDDPAPPPPPPPPPPPTNLLAAKLKAALVKDVASNESKAIVKKLGSVASATSATANGFSTVADVQTYWSGNSKVVAGLTGVLSVRQEINDWLVGEIPWPPSTELNDGMRSSIASTFAKLAAALEEAAK